MLRWDDYSERLRLLGESVVKDSNLYAPQQTIAALQALGLILNEQNRILGVIAEAILDGREVIHVKHVAGGSDRADVPTT